MFLLPLAEGDPLFKQVGYNYRGNEHGFAFISFSGRKKEGGGRLRGRGGR